MAAQEDIAMVLTSGQLWAGFIAIVGLVGWLISYIYKAETQRTNERLTALHLKISKLETELRADFADKLDRQNAQLTHIAATINEAVESLDKSYLELDRRLLRHEMRTGG